MTRLKFIFFLGMMLILGSCSKQIAPGIQRFSKYSTSLARPVWSPSSEKIVVSSYSFNDNTSDILIFETKTSSFNILISEEGTLQAVDWSPDGTMLVLASLGTKSYQKGIWIYNLENRTAEYIGPGVTAAWSHNNNRLAVMDCDISLNEPILNIRLINLDSGEENNIFSGEKCNANFYISWDPNDTSIAFSYDRDESIQAAFSRIYLLDLETNSIYPLTFEESWSPTWGNENQILAFIESNEGYTALRVAMMNVETQCKSQDLKLNVPVAGQIDWSPDGSKWAITGSGNLYVITLENTIGSYLGDELSNCNGSYIR